MKRIILFVALLAVAANALGLTNFGDVSTQFGNVTSSLPGSEHSTSKVGSGPRGCKLVDRTVTIHLDRDKYPATYQHVRDAIRAGKPRVMHIDRDGAEENREQSLAGIPSNSTQDRDEYPMAMSREGGKGAHVRLIPKADNRGAGSAVGKQLRRYCNGQAFRLDVQTR